MRPFEIGLTFTGTVSAGAYSAGVIDFIFEALEEWERQKAINRKQFGDDYGKWDTPWHDVLITGLSGASGGGVVCGLILNSMGRNFSPVSAPTQGGALTGNDFYDAWVNMLGADEILDASDIVGNEVKSLFNSNAVPNIAAALLRAPRYQNTHQRKYINETLAVFLTLTNLRGLPYQVKFHGQTANNLIYTKHSDYAKFIVSNTVPLTKSPDFTFLPTSSASPFFDYGYSQLKAACLGTCAFPLGFKDQPITQQSDLYRNRKNGRGSALPPNYPFEFLSSDGGTLNTQPFGLLHDYMVRTHNERCADGIERNARIAVEVERTIIMIAPLETEETFDPKYNMNDGLFKFIPEIINAMRQESLFDAEEIDLAFDPNVYSRFIIAPVRNDGPTSPKRLQPGITGNVLGTLGAFLSRDFREHDYFLGRRNAQQFLKGYFALPVSAVAKNPVFGPAYEGYKINVDFLVDAQGKPSLPFIPLCGNAAVPAYYPLWPTKRGYDLDKIQDEISERVSGLYNQLSSELHLNWFEEVLGGLLLKNRIVNKVMDTINTTLRANKL